MSRLSPSWVIQSEPLRTLLRMEPDGSNQLRDWGLWLPAMQLADLKPAGGLHFSSYDQLIQAAVAGKGSPSGASP